MKKMDVKGQVSVEYLLVILVILVIFGSISIPLVQNSISSSMDISKTSDISTAVNSIANAVNVVYSNGPGAKRTLSVYIPVNSNFVFDGNAIKMDVTNVTVNNATKTVSADVPYTVGFQNSTTNGTTIGVQKGWYNNVTIQWPISSSSITVNMGSLSSTK